MIKKYFVMFILLCSCGTYIDSTYDGIKGYGFEFNKFKNYNKLYHKSKINIKAHDEMYYTQHFIIDLPKNVKDIQLTNNKYVVEYDSKQLIYIDSGLVNEKKKEKWFLNNFIITEKYETEINSYWIEYRNYNMSQLYKSNKKRISKVYTNGKSKIILFNIKEENFNTFFNFIKSFEEIDSTATPKHF